MQAVIICCLSIQRSSCRHTTPMFSVTSQFPVFPNGLNVTDNQSRVTIHRISRVNQFQWRNLIGRSAERPISQSNCSIEVNIFDSELLNFWEHRVRECSLQESSKICLVVEHDIYVCVVNRVLMLATPPCFGLRLYE